ncbi:SRPBCC family protein [Dyadobacter chenwenxiniae]|uniref:SRPBCC family protein n=1 Tax=Dyadobacter chenwenxiniae TaxID=2906456 RepID=A0A9X1PME1_9BACT|nr:SRPBCC family protein [Dyadobacter chenwenxiniae]MCF0050742.1 SRPBCC family protein [Dyadobacter chenwenxiniae]MCF0063095.1 SRPBCC family protein [Dyadobacter chenwenxiniae]UON84734.1 SRPBCC family protein [Dyadobacter chenwenxiniae]
MKIVLTILAVIACIIVVLLIVAVFVKKEYEVKREITINRPRATVFDYIKFLKNQDHYSKWVMADPTMKKTFSGIDGTVGFKYAWDSKDKNVGQGEQEITDMKEGEKLNIEVRFIRPFEGVGIAEMTTTTAGNDQTRMTWGMRGVSKYPMNITNLFIDGILGKDLEASLSNLKRNLEK